MDGNGLNYDENGEETKHKRKYKWSLDDLDGMFYFFFFGKKSHNCDLICNNISFKFEDADSDRKYRKHRSEDKDRKKEKKKKKDKKRKVDSVHTINFLENNGF